MSGRPNIGSASKGRPVWAARPPGTANGLAAGERHQRESSIERMVVAPTRDEQLKIVFPISVQIDECRGKVSHADVYLMHHDGSLRRTRQSQQADASCGS